MGIYLNPNNRGFWESVNSEIYVDKTDMISYTNKCLNTEQKFICVSRPRRFGKSMALKMLSAYYSLGCDSKELFGDYKISKEESFEKHLNQYNVIYLNMQDFLSEAGNEGVVGYLEQEIEEELEEEYGNIVKCTGERLPKVLRKIYSYTDKQFIFLIDEWDCVMREKREADMLQRQYLDFLRNLLKDQVYVALAYMTGILPVKKYGSHSALNMFWEYSMTDPKQLSGYVGFTEEEVSDLCGRYHMDFEKAKSWYDGYSFPGAKHIYNPKAVVEAMLTGRYSNYWTSTETYEALKVYMDMDFDGLRDTIIALLGGGRAKVNTRTFQNDMKTFETKDDVLTLLIHLGYLAYDADHEEVYIPNREIRDEFENAMSVGGWKEVMAVLKASEKLLEDTLSGNADEVAKALDYAHMEVASVLTYNDENSMSCAISLAYYSARKQYRMIRELPAGKGFADIVFVPLKAVDKPALIVELKYDKEAETAIRQIREKQYPRALERYGGEILLVGINYDKNTKKHSCEIEKYQK